MDNANTPAAPQPGQEFKPGDTITPNNQPAAPADTTGLQPEQPAESTPESPMSEQQPVPTADSVPPAEASPQAATSTSPPEPGQSPAVPGSFDVDTPEPDRARPAPTAVNWTASEFIAHDKSFGWYAALAVVALIVAALVYLLTRDKISTSVVIVAAIALGIYGARKPQQLEYALDGQGVHIGQKFYPFNAFRSFAVIDEGAFSSIAFRPHKRFGQLVTIYFDPKDEEAIIGLLSDRLPLEERHRDAVDSFMKKIRF